MTVDEQWRRLRAILAEVYDLQAAARVLSWDRETYMPPAGHAARAEQLATLSRLAHQRFTSPEVGELLSALEARAGDLDPDSVEAALLRVTRREYDRATRVPLDLVERLSRARSRALQAWRRARDERSFAPFAPALAELVALQRELADALGWQECRYDALLAGREPGLTTARLRDLFAELRAALVPLVEAIRERLDACDDAILRQSYDVERQWELTLEALKLVGFDFARGRQDRSVHPFTTWFGPDDVRVTTRFDPQHLGEGLFATLHEAGHALYALGVARELHRTPLAGGASGGVHESQSRLWENLVGRSRAFWECFLPVAQRVFPAQLGEATVEQVYRAVNRVEPSLIRTEADEVTYNLHIILRFELETALLDGDLRVAEVPAAWNERMRAYLGVTPPTDLEGCLQDIHWTGGLGGFPSYTLGNVISVQLWERALAEEPGIPEAIRRGDLRPLLEWMRTRVHVHGAKYEPEELVRRATGSPIDPGPYLRYIRAKYGELYGL